MCEEKYGSLNKIYAKPEIPKRKENGEKGGLVNGQMHGKNLIHLDVVPAQKL
jgi:hypothetical protein